ncbi:MAG: recombinase family protein [Armatimonadota bacterium]|nr:recombinase family protein [bacterium]
MSINSQTLSHTRVRCAIYTRKSTEEGLDMEYNSLDAQREAAEAYIASQRHEGWVALSELYDDGGFTGGNMERPALHRLIQDIEAGRVDMVVCYKVDRLSRSLLDFARLIEVFDRNNVSFVSVTQQFNTTTSMGRLILNILLSFAQFEREMISDRVRDKIAGAKRKGKFCGGSLPLGYDVDSQTHKLIVNSAEAETVRHIFKRYSELGSGLSVARELNARGITRKSWTTKKGITRPGKPWNGTYIYNVLNNRIYLGETKHKDKTYPGEHDAIVSKPLWDKVHAIIEHNPENGRRKHDAAPALLKGIVRCGHCGYAMYNTYTKRHGKVYRYYVCVKAAKSGYDSCPVKSVAAGEIEQAVIGQLRAVFETPEMTAQTYMQARAHEQQEMERLKEENTQSETNLAQLRAKVSELASSGKQDDDTQSEIRGLGGQIEKTLLKLTDINRELAMLESQRITQTDISDALNKLDPIWEELFPAEQMRVVQLLVEGVTVNCDGLDVRIRTDGLHSLVSELKGMDIEQPGIGVEHKIGSKA